MGDAARGSPAMVIVGSALAAIAVLALALAFIHGSRVDRLIGLLEARPARALPRARVAAALCGAAIASLGPLGLVGVPAGGYIGWVGVGFVRDRRERRRRAAIASGSRDVVEWLEALVASRVPGETALARICAEGVGEPAIDPVLRDVSRAYALGAPLYPALAGRSEAAGANALAALALELARARDLGRASLVAIRATRDALRGAERERLIADASTAEPRLALVLVLCYLPALMLAAIVPLFLGLVRSIAA
ncbi:MAG TPA: hypothetical protein VFM93_12855 [Candidatus Limnocylindria bacterium]|nr:hypothetical protein [Candidatus Limnocylindria bacterium]